MKLISQVFVWNNASKNCCVGYAIAAINWAVGQLLVIVFHSIAFHNRFEIVLPATLNITENLQSKSEFSYMVWRKSVEIVSGQLNVWYASLL